MDSLGGTREAGKDQLGGTREACSTGRPIESRFWKGAGFCITFNTISMANGPVRGKSWGGLHGRLPSTDWLLKCRSERRIPFDREAPGRQERIVWTAREAPERQERTHWTACEAPGRQERITWTACEAPGR